MGGRIATSTVSSHDSMPAVLAAADHADLPAEIALDAWIYALCLSLLPHSVMVPLIRLLAHCGLSRKRVEVSAYRQAGSQPSG
jgi:hypothetical protein